MTRQYYDALDEVLDKPIAYNPSFKKITGSTNAAIFLSQGFYWSKRTKNPDGWFWKTRDDWMEETGLTESELDGAREKCRAAGVMEEKLKGVPATVHYRVNRQKVYELLGVQFPGFPESRIPENPQIPENLESGISENFNRNTENTSGNTSDDDVDAAAAKVSKMYESEIGIISPMIADAIRVAVTDYPLPWFEEAFEIAVKRNARNWSFIAAVLKRSKEGGKSPKLNALRKTAGAAVKTPAANRRTPEEIEKDMREARKLLEAA